MPSSNVRSVQKTNTALIVDDLPVNRKILQGLLNLEGYRTITAEDGEQAVQQFIEHQPDIVFMDVMMPVMDGYQATTRIKALAGQKFVPVIFLTALSESDALVKCVEAGGDDFLSKPYKQEILRAKITSMERIRDLSRIVAEQHQHIESQHRLLLKEQVLAEQIYSRAVTADNLDSEYIHSLARPLSIFSGDMLLTAVCPDGSLHVLMGDFTGHGLAAAVGVLPAAEVFRAMTAKGYSAMEILASINAKLHRLLPTGMFMAASFVVIEPDMQNVTIWNAGMPDVLVLGLGDKNTAIIKHKIVSRFLPLGILDEIDNGISPVRLHINTGDRILLCSDGLTEATNANGEVFGSQRYEQVASESKDSFRAVIAALEDFCNGQSFKDDVSFASIHCMPALLNPGRKLAVFPA